MTTKSKNLKAPKATAHTKIEISDLVEQAAWASEMVSNVRQSIMMPQGTKSPPHYSMVQLAALCGIDKGQFAYQLNKGDLPQGTLNASRSRREFTLTESLEWIRSIRREFLKPRGKRACVIAVSNFKGGSTKTSTSMTLAQSLSLKGHKVLAIDCDPQGSLSALFGISADKDVAEWQTIYPLTEGTSDSIKGAIQTTYWSAIDLVAASQALFNAEFVLPARQMKDSEFEFWNVLNYGLESVRDEYDVIIIDTPPSLSYVTINAIMAADGILMPLPPNGLDFASSAQFWGLLSDLASNLVRSSGLTKQFDFIHVLLARVDSTEATSGVVRSWIAATYKDKLLPVEIPKTTIASSSSAEFGTVYDITKYEGNSKTLKRARDAYDRVGDMLEESVRKCWAGQE